MNGLFTHLSEKIFHRRFWYRQIYLRSDHWRKMRIRKLKDVGWSCQDCGVMSQVALLDVHHLTYDHLYAEQLEDLQVLCRKCHRRRHP